MREDEAGSPRRSAPSSRGARLARRARNAALYLLAVALFFELSARLFLSSEERLRRVTTGNSDAAWRVFWYLRRTGDRPLLEGFARHDERRGWRLKPNLSRIAMPDGNTLSTNSIGLRGRAELAVPKPAGTRRVLLFGDSFTFGEEVSDEETYAHRLGLFLPGVEVANLGVNGYGHDQMWLALREEGLRLQPDAVVLCYVTDDAHRNLLTFRSYAKPRFVARDGALALDGVPVPSPDVMARRIAWGPRFFDLVAMSLDGLRWRSGGEERAYGVTFRILTAFFEDVRKAGAEPYLLDAPIVSELESLDPTPNVRERRVAEFCRAAKIPYRNLRPLFVEKRKAGVTLKTTGHWGKTEHAIVAEGLAAWLSERSGR